MSKDKKNDVMETGLALTGGDFGKKLVDAAIEEHKEAMKKKVIGLVQEILVYIETQREERANVEKNIENLEAKITALQEGKFVVNRAGTITFNDENLQKVTVRGPATCRNCGMPTSGPTPGVRQY